MGREFGAQAVGDAASAWEEVLSVLLGTEGSLSHTRDLEDSLSHIRDLEGSLSHRRE